MKIPFRSSVLVAACTLLLAGSVFAAEFNQRLANLSTRAQVGPGGNTATVGFVIGAGSPKNILIRAVGPSLTSFGFSAASVNSNPKITVFNGAGVQILTNDDWGTQVAGGPNAAALASTSASVGAFALPTNSRDAVLLATGLAPGNYTAQVTSSSTTVATGVALVEIYDVTGSARLMNLSTSAQVGTGGGIIISGLSIAPGTGARKILVRAAGPALTALGVGGALSDPAIAVFDGGNLQIAANDNWESDNPAALKAAFTASGAFPFAAGSKDAALLIDLQPGANYTIQVSGVRDAVNNRDTTGLALIEVYDITPDNAANVSVTSTVASTDTKGAAPGVFTFSRTGATTSPLTLYYSVTGTATPGVDFTSLPGSVTIPAGATSAIVNLSALSTGASASINKDATVSLLPGAGYSIGTNSTASVTIFYNPVTLYIAALRTPSNVTTSTAYGTATVQLSSDNTFALVNVQFSNLSSPETAVYLRLTNGGVGIDLQRLATGQVNSSVWVFQGGSTFTAADVVAALQSGKITLDIETAQFPSAELHGLFVQSSGSIVFTPPDAAPALADTPLTANDASRFLMQATFGPTRTDIDALTGKRQVDLNNWITAQMALPASLHLDGIRADFNNFATGDNPQFTQNNRQYAWWKIAVTGPDQLRQRVAFALSQILVVSDQNATLLQNPLGLSSYYDLLVNGAFGNFRTLLENVTLSPVMGVYLSSLRNTKGTVDKNGVLLTSADENYAREVMQLFTIGLNQLQPDGTLKLDPNGLPIPTYTQATISQTAKVFTGWSFQSADNTSANAANNFRNAASDYLHPMMLYQVQHDTTAKTVVGGLVIPANQSGDLDLKLMLDALVNHPNTGPFISRQLIQRLVTSSPSPGYVYRVAQKFADNGSGVRGDLGAVVRAILTDYEARSSAVAATASFGKLKEPLLRATSLLRAFDGNSNSGRFQIFYNDSATTTTLAQYPLHAPTVFNFYEPNFIQPGTLAAAGLFAPEYQIITDTTAIAIPNQLWNFIFTTRANNPPADQLVGILFDSLIPYSHTPAALVDQVNTLLAAGSMSKATTDRLTALITALPTSTAAPSVLNNNDAERVRSAIYLAITTQQGAVQK